MNNSIWKLTALTGVIGLGCLVILWAQQGLTDPEPSDLDATVTADADLGSKASLEDLENFVGTGQDEPGKNIPDGESTDGNDLSANSEPGKLESESPIVIDEHLTGENSNHSAVNPFDDPVEDPPSVKQTNLTKTETQKKNSHRHSENGTEKNSEDNPFEDKTKTADYNTPISNDSSKTEKNNIKPIEFGVNNKNSNANSENAGKVFLPKMKPEFVQEKKPAKNDEGPIFSPEPNAFQNKTTQKTNPFKNDSPANPFDQSTKTEGQKQNTPAKAENPFTNGEKPILLNREPVKTKTQSKKENKSPNYFPEFELKNRQKAETGNPFDSGSQKKNPEKKPLEKPSPQNREPEKDKIKANPFASGDQSKTGDQPKSDGHNAIPSLPQTMNPLEESPDVKNRHVHPAFVEENRQPTKDTKNEKDDPPQPEVIAEGSQKPQLTIEKIAPKRATLGEAMIYRIVVKNIGRSRAYDVSVEDAVPDDVKLIGSIPRARLKKKTLTWKLGTLNPGDTEKILVKVIPQKEGQLSSSAKVNFTSKVAIETRVDAPRLKFLLSGPEKAELGHKIAYRFKVENVGTVPVKDVWVRSLLPDQLHHPAGTDVESQIGTLRPGESKVLTLQVSARKSGTGIHRAILTASGNFRLESQSAIVVHGEKVKLTRYGPQSRPIGKQAVFTNVVTNKSQETITSAVVTEKVPKGMQFVEATEGGQYDAARRTVNWPLQKLKPDESKSLKIKLIPRIRGKHLTIVKATDKSGTLSNSSSNFEVNGYALLRIEIPATKGPIEVGDAVSMTVTVRNLGTSDASNMRLQFAIPSELKLVDVKGPEKHRQIGQTVEMNPVANIPAGKSVTFEIQLRAAKTGDSRLGVQIRSDEMQKPLSREEAIVILPQ